MLSEETHSSIEKAVKTGVDDQVKNFRDWGIQLGRRFRALKLWFVIRSYGVKGLQEMIREHIRLAEILKNWVEEHKHFELNGARELERCFCFRLNDGRPEDSLNRLNSQFIDSLNHTGKVFLTQTTLKGKYVLRMAIGQRTTEERHVREAWDLMNEKAAELLKGRGKT